MSDADRANLFKLYKTVGTTKVWQIKNAIDTTPFFFVSGMSVDVDGAPNAIDVPRHLEKMKLLN